MIEGLRAVPPWVLIAVTAAAGLAVLTYHRFTQDDTDPDWTAPKELQAPTVAPFPMVPGASHVCGPMDCCAGFRQRRYAGSLVDAQFSIIGEF